MQLPYTSYLVRLAGWVDILLREIDTENCSTSFFVLFRGAREVDNWPSPIPRVCGLTKCGFVDSKM